MAGWGGTAFLSRRADSTALESRPTPLSKVIPLTPLRHRFGLLSVSIEPVFHAQRWNLLEILEVRGSHQRSVDQTNASNLEVHRTDADAIATTAFKPRGRVVVKRQDRPTVQEVEEGD